jgi:hypothetical protein
MTSQLSLSSEALSAIQKILAHLESSQAEFQKLSAVEQRAVYEFHNEGASLTHCLRWGEQAATELLSSESQGSVLS